MFNKLHEINPYFEFSPTLSLCKKNDQAILLLYVEHLKLDISRINILCWKYMYHSLLLEFSSICHDITIFQCHKPNQTPNNL